MISMSLMKKRVDKTLLELKINGTCVNFSQHRHLAFCDIKLEPGAIARKLETRADEIALSLKSKTQPVVQPLFSEGIVRLKFAMQDSEKIYLNDLIRGTKIPSIKDNLLPFLLGETDNGERLIVDMAKNPHMLIAGQTGSGKSVMLHNLVANASILHNSKERAIKLYLIDPKQVEFSCYKKEEYSNLVSAVESDYNNALSILEYLNGIMNARYKEMSKRGIQSIEDKPNLFPTIILMIDEIADLLMQDKKIKMFETNLTSLAQKARACGIFIIAATQRPSRDIITGTLKANFPARLAFKMGYRIDSQVVLDTPGAERLLSRGDALIKCSQFDMVRFQSAYISQDQVLENHLFTTYKNPESN